MKTKNPLWLLVLSFSLVMPLWAAEEQGSDTNSPPQPAQATEAAKPDTAAQGQSPAPDAGGTNQAPASAEAASNDSAPLPEGTLRMNFRGAPLNLVLDYLSDAAGFIINKETEVRGTVDVWSKDPVSKEEAVQLLNSVLKKNGYAVTRNGRILTIVSLETAKTADLEVVTGSDPQEVERSDEVVTQIIPVRFANATQLMNNLQVLLPTSATLSVNESANSLILVATKTDIRRMLRIVTALDTSISSVTSIKVFPLRYADAKALATVVQQLFATQASGQGAMGGRAQQFFNMFQRGGPGGGGPGGMAGQAGGTSGASGGGSKVVAAADEYSNSLIVTAAAETMATIASMVEQVDQPVDDLTVLRVFTLHNADPTELAEQLDELFPDETRSNSNQRGGFRFFGGGAFGGNNQSTGTSQRTLKKSKVISVADARTSSLIVAASSELMPQIAEMIAKLDSSPAKKENVAVFDLQNANPQDVYQVLQDLFNRNNSMRNNNNNNRSSMLGQNNPLTQRSTQTQSSTTSGTSRFGSGTSSRTGGSSMGF